MRFEFSTPAHVRELEILLSETFDFPVRVRGIEQIAPWAVGRCRLAAASGSPIPETVIVKWLRSDANNFRTDPLQLLTERAGLQFLQRIGFTAVPRVFAASDDLVVMEDVSPRKALNQMLAERDSTAPAALQAFAQTLGELHAATVGRDESYYEMRRALGPIEPVDELIAFSEHV